MTTLTVITTSGPNAGTKKTYLTAKTREHLVSNSVPLLLLIHEMKESLRELLWWHELESNVEFTTEAHKHFCDALEAMGKYSSAVWDVSGMNEAGAAEGRAMFQAERAKMQS